MDSPAAWGVVGLAGLYFLALGAASLLLRPIAMRFLLGFAGSPARHYAELGIRMVVGAAFVVAAPQAPWTWAFQVFGWLLIGTTAALLLVPWQSHQRFAQGSVPRVSRHLPLLGGMSLIAGLAILAAVHRAITV